MRNSLPFALAFCLLIPCLAASAQSGTLSKTRNETVLDGSIQDGEYSFTKSFNGDKLKLYLNWSDRALSVAVTAETRGWVGAGLNSLRMNGANILVGYVRGRDQAFRIDDGRGHAHSLGDQGVELGHALTEQGRWTTMEVQLQPDAFIQAGQSSLQVIVAYGNADGFKPIHRFRTADTVQLER